MMIKKAEEAQSVNEARFTKNIIFNEGKSTVFILNFLPGQALPPHPHPNAHVYLYVMEGNGICTIDDEKHDITVKDIIHCENKQVLSIENTGSERLSIYVVLARESS
ncbi:cupin domain-containing protein [Lederbergia wuyishanensis]|uniref:Mannose-6-phosphate isomerase-like protein (Cupin superfamily) n=1 Tax=Lederbergia wuyishanensis TaxID=1347903 RepID=A0ABU0DAX7_9BACI|nr:cupin domain-containing protein [Lederbergia wuyishanensis]MCJ8010065.1 cupin domain-containing protein [Lederbergia wuyishanensis]MDQ0345579.1 mannose-6-phosphate isomerase-like protein (cupin superfamily) [Lederbergia wuyishanensis]